MGEIDPVAEGVDDVGLYKAIHAAIVSPAAGVAVFYCMSRGLLFGIVGLYCRMQIMVFDKYSIRDFRPECPTLLIRISSKYPFPRIDESLYAKVAEFGFEDTEYRSEYSITNDEAAEIAKLIAGCADGFDLAVHCDYGRGRSPAVAIAAANILLGGDVMGLAMRYPSYNKLVYREIMAQASANAGSPEKRYSGA
ncbi:hypothetical protein ACXWTF_13085 [Thiomicrolovo sp. ZZH C-3]